jgi:hypothetical protein
MTGTRNKFVTGTTICENRARKGAADVLKPALKLAKSSIKKYEVQFRRDAGTLLLSCGALHRDGNR